MIDCLRLTADRALRHIADDDEQELSLAIENIVRVLASKGFSTSGDGGQVGPGGADTGSSSAVSSARGQVAGGAVGSPGSPRNAKRFESDSSAIPVHPNGFTSLTSNVLHV